MALEAAVYAYLGYLVVRCGIDWVRAHPDEVSAMVNEGVVGVGLISGRVSEILAKFLSENRRTPDVDRIRDRLSKLPKGSARSPKEDTSLVPDEGAVENLYGELTEGGSFVDPGKYPGRRVEIPGGTRVEVRERSASGGRTIDVRYPDGTSQPVHIPKEK